MTIENNISGQLNLVLSEEIYLNYQRISCLNVII